MTHEEFCDWIVDTNFPEWKGYYIYDLTPALIKGKDGYYWTLLDFSSANTYIKNDKWKPQYDDDNE